jgi:hypothetical protein
MQRLQEVHLPKSSDDAKALYRIFLREMIANLNNPEGMKQVVEKAKALAEESARENDPASREPKPTTS